MRRGEEGTCLVEKFIKASLDSSNLELWESDQLKAPPGYSIMLISLWWVSSKSLPVASRATLST